jgi:hypothetical protein
MAEPIPPALERALRNALSSDERVVWRARPAAVSRVLASALTVIQAVVVGAFLALLATVVTQDWGPARPSVAHFWVAVLGGLGAALLVIAFRACWLARHTVYAVTDRRALLIEVWPWRVKVQSFAGKQLANALVRADRTGHGTLILGLKVYRSGQSGNISFSEIGFFGIENAEHVARMLPTTAPIGPGRNDRAAVAHDA